MSETEAALCSIGKSGVDSIVCNEPMYLRDDLSAEEIRLLRARSGSTRKKKMVCEAHMRNYLWSYESKEKHCCNPFGEHDESDAETKKKGRKKGTQTISLEYRDKAKQLDQPYLLIPGKKLCITCNIKFSKMLKAARIEVPSQIMSSPSKSSKSSQASVSSQPIQQQQQQLQPSPGYGKPPSQSNVANLNNWLAENNEDVIDFANLIKLKKSYVIQQLDKVNRVLLFCASIDDDNSDNVSDWYKKSQLYNEFLKQLQDYYILSNSRTNKICALSVLPKSLSVQAIRSLFPSTSDRIVRKVDMLRTEKGLFCTPDKKAGRPLEEWKIKAVSEFYLRQDVSKEQPGKSQVISVKESDGKRVKKQKRLLLGNLKHLHEEFINTHPQCEVSFPKFAQLRPKECVLVTSGGMHNICVCVHHENPELIFQGANLKNHTLFKTATDCLKKLMCQPSTPECGLRLCKSCPDENSLRDYLLSRLDVEMAENNTFNQWETTDRSNIVTVTCSTEDFVDRFTNQLQYLIPHHFIYKQQAEYFRKQKASLQEGEVMVVGDFAENYTFQIQNMIQAYYFRSNKQATIHPFSCYIKLPRIEETEQYSCAVVSDCMDHSTVTFYTFQKKLIQHLRDKYEQKIKNIIYYSDGCGGQYKNRKQAANVCYHKKDFGIEAEWHFFATSHGKSACDGIGGTMKRLASHYSLQHTQPGLQIETPYKLFTWCQKNINGIYVMWVTKEEVTKEAEFLAVRFEGALPIEGIKKCHSIIPLRENYVTLKRYSAAMQGEVKQISKAEEGVAWDTIRGFVTFWNKDDENPKWYLGTVQDKFEDTARVLINKLVLKENKTYDYVYSDEDSLMVPAASILTLPKTSVFSKGQLVKILAADSKTTDAVFKKMLSLTAS